MTPRKTFQNLSPEKQERITRIAVEEFGNKGFDGASINAMVSRMKIAKGSIFQYFGDKKGLFLFVFSRSVEMVKDYLRTVRDQSANDDLATRLTKILSAGIVFIKQHPLLYRLYTKVLFDPKVPFRDEILTSLRQYSTEYLKSLLENARIKNELKSGIDPDKAAFVLDAVMDRFLCSHTIKHLDSGLGIYHASSEETNIWIAEISHMICNGLVSCRTDEKNSLPSALRSSRSPCILVIAAVDDELAELSRKLSFAGRSMIGTRNVISGKLGKVHVKLLVSGPGMINTAQALTAVIEHEKPHLIIQTGCAGVFRQSGLGLGDVGIATKEIDIHTGLESSCDSDFPDEPPFALIETQKKIKNHYPVHAGLTNHAYEILQSARPSLNFQVKKGVFVTVSTITTTNKRAEALVKKFSPCMEQMEGAAAAHLSLVYDIPFIEIRSAINYVGKRDKDSWRPELAFKNVCEAVYLFLQELELDKLKY